MMQVHNFLIVSLVLILTSSCPFVYSARHLSELINSPINSTVSQTLNGTQILPNVINGTFNRPVQSPFTNTTVANGTQLLIKDQLDQMNLANVTVSDLNFISFDPAFDAIVGKNPKLLTMAQKNYSFAHEGPVWLDDLNSVFFVSNRLGNLSSSNQYVELWLMDATNGNLTQVKSSPEILMANGATRLGNNEVLLLSQGVNNTAAGIYAFNPALGNATELLNNNFGLVFNSPNDIAVYPDGTIFFSDPSYGFDQEFKNASQLGEYVWKLKQGQGPPEVAADGFIRPNGVCFSNDFKTLYISDTGFVYGNGSYDPSRPHSIYAYDVDPESLLLSNKRVFATSSTGIPDGIKVDADGNVYTGVGDGVYVYSPEGKLLGIIEVGMVANLVFGGKNDRSRLFMMQENRVSAVDLNVGAHELPDVVYTGNGIVSLAGQSAEGSAGVSSSGGSVGGSLGVVFVAMMMMMAVV